MSPADRERLRRWAERQDEHEARSRLAAIVESSADAIIGKSLDGTVVSWNPAAERLYGYAAAEIEGKSITTVIPLDRRHEFARIMKKLKVGGRIEHFETVRVRKDGRRVAVSISVSPVRDATGQVVGAATIARDISERREAERERDRLVADLRRANELLVEASLAAQKRAEEAEAAERRLAFLAGASKLLASSLDYEITLTSLARLAVLELADWCAVTMLETDGSIHQLAPAHANPEWARLAQELHRDRPPEPHQCPRVLRVLATGRPELYADITEDQPEKEGWDHESLEKLRGMGVKSIMIVPLVARGRTLGAISFAFADSGRQFSPADLVLAEELAHHAALAVDNARLYREAQEAVRLRDEFLSVAAHELRTPVTSLRGFAQLAMRQAEKEAPWDASLVHQAVEIIDQQSGKLSMLVSRLLDVSRLDAGQLVLDRKLADIMGLIRSVAATAQAATSRHAIAVAGPLSLIALVDPLRLEQVVSNLIDNAVKYSPDGGPVEVEVTKPDPDTVQLTVTDQGIGIPPEHRPWIFDRFHQCHADGNLGGLGLGLYISRQILHLHGGYIEAEFPPEGGSRFVVTLPTGLAAGSHCYD